MFLTKELVCSGYFKNLKEPPGFMKESRKEPAVFYGVTELFEPFENRSYVREPGI
jgi:hypothetical protein